METCNIETKNFKKNYYLGKPVCSFSCLVSVWNAHLLFVIALPSSLLLMLCPSVLLWSKQWCIRGLWSFFKSTPETQTGNPAQWTEIEIIFSCKEGTTCVSCKEVQINLLQTKSLDLDKDVSCCDPRKHSAPRCLEQILLIPKSLVQVLLLLASNSEGPQCSHSPLLAQHCKSAIL